MITTYRKIASVISLLGIVSLVLLLGSAFVRRSRDSQGVTAHQKVGYGENCVGKGLYIEEFNGERRVPY